MNNNKAIWAIVIGVLIIIFHYSPLESKFIKLFEVPQIEAPKQNVVFPSLVPDAEVWECVNRKTGEHVTTDANGWKVWTAKNASYGKKDISLVICYRMETEVEDNSFKEFKGVDCGECKG